MIKVIFSCGDVNGIGPEIAVKVFSKIFKSQKTNHIIYITPFNVFNYYYKKLKADFKFSIIDSIKSSKSNLLNIIKIADTKLSVGKITSSAGKASYLSLQQGVDLIIKNEADILVTPPLSKESVNKAGIKFIGHTEYLANRELKDEYLMTFVSDNLIASLVTIHEPIKNVSGLLSKEKLKNDLLVFHKSLEQDLGVKNPRIAVLGLNPHAGENGLIGKEESEIITPVIKSFKDHYNIYGPFVPDAFWGNQLYKKFDAVLGMYHDQILIPFKMLNFNSGVNYTAGLKMIRTSPDHGTAFDIAGKNIASPSSLYQAYKVGLNIYHNRKKYFASSKSK